MKTIFDIGSNNGDDIPYYLLKADRVVAFEANPQLCEMIRHRFTDDIQSGRLNVVEGVLSTDADAISDYVDFYIHKENHVLSQFPEPKAEISRQFKKLNLKVHRISDVISHFQEPYYIKIDIEHYDHKIIAELFRLGVHPTYLSAECHSPEVIRLLTESREYRGFKLVEGLEVAQKYNNVAVESGGNAATSYSFPHHSAGPFGDDIEGPWLSKKTINRLVAVRGLGWRDLHASRIDEGKSKKVIESRSDAIQYSKFHIRKNMPKPMLAAFRALKRRIS